MVITNLEEKENRKIWVPIRPGNRGGWSLFEWEKVREMPYRDREMYLGNSAKIGVLDKGGKWRKKDWYLKRNELTASELDEMRSEAMRKDMQRMNTALGITEKDDDQKLTPAEMQLLLKKIKGGNAEQPVQIEGDAIGLGFDKTKVEIRAKPAVQVNNPHRLQGNYVQQEVKEPRNLEKSQKKQKKKHKKQRKHRERSQSRHSSREKHQKLTRKYEQDSYEQEKTRKRHRSRSRSESKDRHRHRRNRSRSESEKKERHRKREKRDDSRCKQSEIKNDKYRSEKHRSKGSRYESESR